MLADPGGFFVGYMIVWVPLFFVALWRIGSAIKGNRR